MITKKVKYMIPTNIQIKDKMSYGEANCLANSYTNNRLDAEKGLAPASLQINENCYSNYAQTETDLTGNTQAQLQNILSKDYQELLKAVEAIKDEKIKDKWYDLLEFDYYSFFNAGLLVNADIEYITQDEHNGDLYYKLIDGSVIQSKRGR